MFNLPKRMSPTASNEAAVDAFIEAARAPTQFAQTGRGRLIFALDATMSRQPTWDLATRLQGRMFDTTAQLGGLDVQLVYFRGFSECRASSFVSGGAGLARVMERISVSAGPTQIGRVLSHAREEASAVPVAALVYVGDALEEEAAPLLSSAAELALLGTKAFMFQEGRASAVAATFRAIAGLTGGAYAPFDSSAPDRLAALLAAAAAYAAGGRAALDALVRRAGTAENMALLQQLR